MHDENPGDVLARFARAMPDGAGADISRNGAVADPCLKVIERLRAGDAYEGGECQLPAPFFAWLMFDESFAASLRGNRIRIKGVQFDRLLNLTGLDRRWSLMLRGCTFDAGLDLAGASLRELDLSTSRARWIHAPTLRLAGDLVAHDLTAGPLVLEDAKVDGSVRLAGARLGACLECVGEIHSRLQRAIYPERAALAADRLHVAGQLELRASREPGARRRFESRGTVCLRSAKVGGVLDLQGASLLGDGFLRAAANGEAKALVADSIQIDGPVFLTSWEDPKARDQDPIPFKSIGTIDFSESKIDGSVWVGRRTHSPAAEIAESSGAANPEAVRKPDAELRVDADNETADSGDVFLLSRSDVSGSVNLFAAEIAGAVRLPNTGISGSIDIRASSISHAGARSGVALDCDGAEVGDTLFILHSRLTGLVSAIEAKFTCEIMIDESSLTAGAGERGAGVALSLRGVRAGYVHLRGRPDEKHGSTAIIAGRVNFAQARIDSNLEIEGTLHRWSPHGAKAGRALITLDTAQINGELAINPIGIGDPPQPPANGAEAEPAAINGRGLHAGRDVKIGPEKASSTRIDGSVNLTNAGFGGDVLIRRVRIRARSAHPLDLSGSSIAGNLKLRTIELSRSARVLRRDGNAFYDADSLKAVVARDCDIKGWAGLYGRSSLRGGIDFGGTHVAADFRVEAIEILPPEPPPDAASTASTNQHLEELEKAGFHALNLARATIGGDWIWGAPLEDEDIDQQQPQGSPVPRGIVNLGNARIGRLCPFATWQPDWVPAGELPTYLRLAGCSFEQIGAASLTDIDWPRWVALQDPQRFSVQPYEQLGQVLRAMGRRDAAEIVARQKLRENRRRSRASFDAIDRVDRIRATLASTTGATTPQSSSDPFATDLFWLRVALFVVGVVWTIALFAVIPQHLPVLAQVPGLLLPRDGLDLLDRHVVRPAWAEWQLVITLTLLALVVGLILARRSIWPALINLWGRLLDYGIGYGYRPMRAVALSALVVMTGAIVYHHAAAGNHLHPVDARRFDPSWPGGATPSAGPQQQAQSRSEPPKNYPKLNPLLYSFEQFVPFIALKHVQYWELDGQSPTWLHAYKALHILLGYVLVTAVALSPISIFRKD